MLEKTYRLKTALHYTGRVIYYAKLNNSRRLGKGTFRMIPDVRRLSEVLFTKNTDCASGDTADAQSVLCNRKNPPAMQGEGGSLDLSKNACAKINKQLKDDLEYNQMTYDA